MFFATYKSTIKNIVRSKTFWLALTVLAIFVVYSVTSVTHLCYSFETGGVIEQGHPLFVFSYQNYIQKCNGVVANMLAYAVPVFAVTLTALILNRDYGDKYFEIEKSCSLRASQYLFARLLAVFTVCFCTVFVCCFVYLHGQMIPMLGCDEMTDAEYFADSAVRLTMQIVASVPPCLIFYICSTYLAGTCLKNGVGGAIVNLSYVIFCYIYDMLNIENTGLFMEYLRPSNPIKLNHYMYYYDSEWFDMMLETFETSLTHASICWSILIGMAAIFCAVSLVCIQKRTV